MKILFIGIALIIFGIVSNLAAQSVPSASEIERSQELLNEQRELNRRIYDEDKVFVERIILKGASALTSGQIDGILGAFEQKWFSRHDIQGLIDAIEMTYKNNNLPIKPQISYQVNNDSLEITVKEMPASRE